MDKLPIGVITTIRPDVAATIRKLKDLGVSVIQLLYHPGDIRSVEHAKEIKSTFDEAGVTVTLIFATYENEDYSTIQGGRDTGGLVPPATRASRTVDTNRIADYAAAMDCSAIALHFGTIPENRDDPEYKPIVAVAQEVCDYCQSLGLRVHLETGEDTAETLLNFIHDVDRPNLAVNFDPANMILYGRGDPIPALKAVSAHVKSCHCKDATWSDQPMVVWGTEVPFGDGQVNAEQFVKTLIEIGYEGPLSIEREVEGEQQIIDTKKAIKVLEELKRKYT